MSLKQQLKEQTAAVKLRRSVFGVRKRLGDEDRQRAAHPFHADAGFMSAAKKLLDTSDPIYRNVMSTIGRARSYWKSVTVFYPVKGIRLIRRDLVDAFEAQMQAYSEELARNLSELGTDYIRLKNEARQKLGTLYRADDYPETQALLDEFSISWEYPSVEPPDYLRQINPRLYEQEQARIAARFEEAMATAEQVLATEMKQLIGTLCDKLAPSDGKRKVLSQSALDAFREFTERFKTVHITDGSDLEELVSQAEFLTKGLDPSLLKKNPEQQGQLFKAMDEIKGNLDQLIIEAPTRKITLEDEGEDNE